MPNEVEQYTGEVEAPAPESERTSEDRDSRGREQKQSSRSELYIRRPDLANSVVDTHNRAVLINGRQVRVQENKVVPEVLLDVEEARVEEGAQEDADAIMEALKQRMEEIRAENPDDAEAQIHKIEILAAVKLKKEIESIHSEHALAATLSSIFLTFSADSYRIPTDGGGGPVFDDWEMGHRFDMTAHAYVIPYSKRDEMQSLLKTPPLPNCLREKVSFNFAAGKFFKDDYLDGKEDGGASEIGFTVQYEYKDKKSGITKTEEIMFFYGKEIGGDFDGDVADRVGVAKEDK
jgi:hypothetical protein